jgi:signal transduction histidine kinase
MVKARDTGEASMSNPVTLVQETDVENAQPGILIFMPIYERNEMPQTQTQRRAALDGYSYAVLRTEDMLGTLLQQHANDERFAFTITDESPDNGGVLYTSPRFADISQDQENLRSTHLLSHMNQVWQIEIALDEDVFRQGNLEPTLIFVLGSMTSVLIGAFLFVLMLNRLGRIAVLHEVELQKTKDELLALASHQLRTPASGVKQYVGMVLQGYSGKLSDEQRQMLERAYEANDRQLEIINQLLYVAKADAGQLRIEKENHNFTKLVKEVVEDYGEWAAEQKLDVKAGRLKQVELKADQRYMRMIVENIISNAIKYSYEGGTVSINIATKGRKLIFSVTDQGVGIREKDIPLLFQKFTRIDNELSRRVGGSGIGLYLAQELAKAHGGEITVDTTARKGATFTLTIPGVVQQRSKKRAIKKSE